MATLNPSPSFPSRFFAGTRTSSKMIEEVADALIPIFFSCFPSETPFHFMSTTNAVIPLCDFALSVIVKRTQVSACGAFVMKFLVPLTT